MISSHPVLSSLGVFSLLAPIASAGNFTGLAFDRLITIWLENQDQVKVAADPDIVALKEKAITLTNFYALTHPSQPNYIASLSGDYFGLDHDDPVTIPENVSTIVDVLDHKDISWGGYFEGIPSPGYMGEGSIGVGSDTWDYVRKHNPFVSFESISHYGGQLGKVRSFKEFLATFATSPSSLPEFIFMSPNMLNDGHNTTLDYATKWSTSFLEPLLVDDAWHDDTDGGSNQRTLIMLTYDESETYEKPNHITTLLLGSAIPEDKRGTEDDTFYTHYSMLSTIQYNWHLPCLGRYDVGANVFSMVLEEGEKGEGGSGWKNKEPPNADDWDNSISYYGALNRDPRKRRAVPAPNTKLVGAGGEEVLQKVKLDWNLDSSDVPYDGSGTVYDAKTPPVYKPAKVNAEKLDKGELGEENLGQNP